MPSAAAAEQSPESFGMTDLEEVLRGPDGAEARESIISRLSERLAEIDARIAQGVPQQEFEAVNAIQRSLVTARNVMLLFR